MLCERNETLKFSLGFSVAFKSILWGGVTLKNLISLFVTLGLAHVCLGSQNRSSWWMLCLWKPIIPPYFHFRRHRQGRQIHAHPATRCFRDPFLKSNRLLCLVAACVMALWVCAYVFMLVESRQQTDLQIRQEFFCREYWIRDALMRLTLTL